jgi:CBS domain containing-hemolysin-like protein
MVWIERDKSLRQALSLALRSGYSRIPVVGENLDNIIGIAYVKDLAKRALDHHEAETTEKVEQHMRPAVFVPEIKIAAELLKEMQRDQIHLAIVVDEYGGTAGIITIEDIIEEIVGEIADEFDDGVEAFIWITEDKARAKATLHIEDLADELKVDIDKADFEDVDSIGGLMAQKLGRVPIAGSTISIAGWTITSERPVGRRRKISSVIIERIKDEAPEDHE